MNQTPSTPTRHGELWAGIKDTFPLIVGTIPFGIIFGAVAVTSGVSVGGAMAMSAFVFAGSSQFIAAGLIGGGASALVIIVTTFVVNLRHALYAASLAPHMKHLPQRWLAPLGFWLTDESYVVVITRYTQPDSSPYKHWYHLGSSVFMYTNWQVCTWIGLIAGQAIPNPRAWGLDFALVVTFIGMLAQFIRNKPALVAAVVAGATAVIAHGLPNQIWLLLAALAGIAAGMVAESALPAKVATETSEVSEAGRVER